MLHFLRRRDQRGIERAAFQVPSRLVALPDDPLHAFAGLCPGGNAEKLEDLFAAAHVSLGDLEVIFESRAELFVLGRPRHFREGLRQLLLGVVHVAELLDKQLFQVFGCHRVCPFVLIDRRSRRRKDRIKQCARQSLIRGSA